MVQRDAEQEVACLQPLSLSIYIYKPCYGRIEKEAWLVTHVECSNKGSPRQCIHALAYLPFCLLLWPFLLKQSGIDLVVQQAAIKRLLSSIGTSLLPYSIRVKLNEKECNLIGIELYPRNPFREKRGYPSFVLQGTLFSDGW